MSALKKAMMLAAANVGIPNDPYFIGIASSSNPYTTVRGTTDSEGNTYVVGYYGVTKLDVLGDLIWSRSVSSVTRYAAVAVDSSGNVYVAGHDLAVGASRGLLVKYDSEGILQWSVGLFRSSYPIAFRDVVVSDSAVYVVGGQYYDGVDPDYIPEYLGVVVKYDITDGSIVWKKLYNQGEPWFNACAIDADDNLYITGQNFAYTRPGACLLKLNTSGAQLWGRTIYDNSGSYDLHGGGVCIDADYNAYISAQQNGSAHLFAGFDTDGATIFQTMKSGGVPISLVSNLVCGIQAGEDGYLYAAVPINPGSTHDIGFIKLDPATGTTVFSRRFKKTADTDYYSLLTLDFSGPDNVVLVGTKGSPDYGFVLRILSDGGGTGVYGSYTYSDYAINFTVSTRTIVNSGTSNVGDYTTATAVTPTVTDSAGSWSAYVYQSLS